MDDGSKFRQSKQIHRTTGRTFYLATRLLPSDIRRATYALYGFFRVADDIVDDPNPPAPEIQREQLNRLQAIALGEKQTDDAVLSAFAAIREDYDIPESEVMAFIDAMKQDIEPTLFETHADLRSYLRGSAVAVAWMMLAVMSPEMSTRDIAQARAHARSLGEAYQLTNFLRDVREDVQLYNRIYLPRSRLDEFGVTPEEIRSLEDSQSVRRLIAAEIKRTNTLYRHGIEGISYLPKNCRFPILLSAVLYVDHHQRIQAHDYDVLSDRHTLSMPRRLSLLIQTAWHWKRTANPIETFYAASYWSSESNSDQLPPQTSGDTSQKAAYQTASSTATEWMTSDSDPQSATPQDRQ